MAELEPLLVECPVCNEQIHVALQVKVSSMREGNLVFDITPELEDLWLHVWTHTHVN